MRIALLCPYSLSRPGGVQGQVVGLATALAARGHEATVLAPADGPVSLPGLAPDGPQAGGPDPARPVRLVRLGGSVALPANGSMAPVALGPRAAWRAVRAVRDGDFDVLHLHEPLAPGPGWACLAACALPKVGTFHRAGGSLAYRLLGPLARAGAGRLSARCAVSAEAAATARHALGGDYEIIGNGIDLARFAGAAPWPTTGPTAVFIGRHERRKGLGVLLEAFDRLGTDSRLTLWVAGEGPDTEALSRRHPPSHRLAWLGRVGDDELAGRLAGAHALCAPSLGGESFGVVLLEAMAARCAVVASDLPGYAAVVGDHGVLVAPGDVAALAAALASVAADAAAGTGRCAPVVLDAAAAHAARWAMPEVARHYLEVYGRVAPRARAG